MEKKEEPFASLCAEAPTDGEAEFATWWQQYADTRFFDQPRSVARDAYRAALQARAAAPGMRQDVQERAAARDASRLPDGDQDAYEAFLRSRGWDREYFTEFRGVNIREAFIAGRRSAEAARSATGK